MAKGNMLLGYARGKVGSLVFSRTNGQQITRMKASKVKNPQTDAQVIQRILLNTVAQAYSALQPICDHSFEGIKSGQDSMSYFMRTNLKSIRANIGDLLEGKVKEDDIMSDFTPIGQNGLSLNNYVIAKGSLPAIPQAVEDLSSIYYNLTPENPTLLFNLATASTQNITDMDEMTYQHVLDWTGLQRGDQLTFVVIVADDAKNLSARWARIILDPKEVDGSDAPLTTQLFSVGDGVSYSAVKGNPANVIPEGFGFYTVLPAYNTVPAFSVSPTVAGASVLGAGVIVSRQKTDGTWERSNAEITTLLGVVMNSDVNPKYTRTTIEKAVADFRSKGFSLGSEWYLNNATD